jgi:hypothetical protein
MEKILLVSPCGEATGNRTTALRYVSIFQQSEFEVMLMDALMIEESALNNLVRPCLTIIKKFF